MLLELLTRRNIQQEEFRRLDLTSKLDIASLPEKWREALQSARQWISKRSAEEAGCLYTHPDTGLVFAPADGEKANLLYGKAYGVLPVVRGVQATSFSESEALRKSLESFFHRPLA